MANEIPFQIPGGGMPATPGSAALQAAGNALQGAGSDTVTSGDVKAAYSQTLGPINVQTGGGNASSQPTQGGGGFQWWIVAAIGAGVSALLLGFSLVRRRK